MLCDAVCCAVYAHARGCLWPAAVRTVTRGTDAWLCVVANVQSMDSNSNGHTIYLLANTRVDENILPFQIVSSKDTTSGFGSKVHVYFLTLVITNPPHAYLFG